MNSIENFQPVRAVRPGRPAPPPSFWTWFRVGFFGGTIGILLLLLLILIILPGGRFNFLILGLDRRPGETAPSRTDTMMLVTINPAKQYVGLLSIPRDLWVTLPDGSSNRVNTAHFFAEAQSAGSGPAAAVQTVAGNFGVTVDRYVRLDLAGFVQLIDSVGGIRVNVETPMIDYQFPTYDYGTQVVSFEAGLQHMTGEQALQYARIRHGSSDFARAKRQQAVIAAFIARLLEPGAWVRLPLLLATVQSTVDTNITLWEALRLLPTVAWVGADGIDRRVIEGDMVQPYTTAGGASVQLPIWDKINPVLFDIFGQ